jgi:histone acetyltransferase
MSAGVEPAAKKARTEDGAVPQDDEIKSRDFTAKQEEERGILHFRQVHNDGTPESLRWLCELKEIFGTQLPSMPKEYIVRLVFDKNHKSVCAIKNIGGVQQAVGGICYRPYYQEKLGEIAFCAIKTDQQVRGYGTRLMNQTKHFACTVDKLDHFVTYADNFAIGYFKKQGFHMQISMYPERWKPHIKDYEGATVMECYINPNIDYLDIPAMVSRQRKAVQEKVAALTRHDVINPGLPMFKNGTKKIEVHEIPGVLQGGFTKEGHLAGRGALTERESNETLLGQSLQEIFTNIEKSDHSWPFMEAVRQEEVPDYYNVIKDPIDLSKIQEKLNNGIYKTKEMFLADITLMCENCKTFNPPDTIFYKTAHDLHRLCDQEMRRLGLL